MPARRESEMGGDRLAHVGEGAAADRSGTESGPKARIGTCSRVWSVPRQVGSLPWSAVRMTRSPGFSRACSSGRRAVEGFERRRIAGDVAPVAEQRVEIDEIGEDEVAVAGIVRRRRASCRRAPSLSGALSTSQMPRWAKMSPILPMPTIAPPAPRRAGRGASAPAAAWRSRGGWRAHEIVAASRRRRAAR